jgi:trk system potassium uptake protein
MNAVIIGCGRVGARIAASLDASGHRVSIVDIKTSAFQRLPQDFGGLTVVGTGIDEDILRSAGIEDAEVFIAVTNGDNTNIMAAQLAQTVFNIPSATARIYDPVREETYRKMGIHTICPTTTIASLILSSITPA